MSRQQRGGGRTDVARGAGYAAFLGAVLIGVAVIIGIVLLQIGDKNDNGPSAGATHPKSTTTTTTKKKTSGSTPHTNTTNPRTPVKTPSQVHLIVLNGGAPSGQAAHTSSGLQLRGYTNIDKANTWSGHHQVGNTVYCRAGLGREGAALAAQVPHAKLTIGYPTPAPPFSAGTDCVVVVGS